MTQDNEDRRATSKDVQDLLSVAPVSDALATEIGRRLGARNAGERWYSNLQEYAQVQGDCILLGDTGENEDDCTTHEHDDVEEIPVQVGDPSAGVITLDNVARFLIVQHNDDGDTFYDNCFRDKLEESIIYRHDEGEGWYLSEVIDLDTGKELVYEIDQAVRFPNGIEGEVEDPKVREDAKAQLRDWLQTICPEDELDNFIDSFLTPMQRKNLADDHNEGR